MSAILTFFISSVSAPQKSSHFDFMLIFNSLAYFFPFSSFFIFILAQNMIEVWRCNLPTPSDV